MDLWKDKRFYRFLLPSLAGLFLFVTPVVSGGNLTIPVAVAAHGLLDLLGDSVQAVLWALITLSAALTAIHRTAGIPLLRRSEKMDRLFSVSGFWFWVRMLGAVYANMLFFGFGPEWIIGGSTGGLVIRDLLPILLCMFLPAGFLLSLLLNYGLLDFLGAMLVRFMRPVFNLPGRSALDCIASWLGDGSIGVILTSRQYEEGFYTRREAAVIATSFSAVSITFCLVIISQVGLSHLFLPFYLAVTLSGVAAAVIVPRLPPLSRIPDTRICADAQAASERAQGARAGLQLALKKAQQAPGAKAFLCEGAQSVAEMWFGSIPVVLAMGTTALIIASYTPVFTLLGKPFILLFQLLQIPEAALASETVLVGFADMFLPSVMISGVESELTRFVVAAVSVSQLIYMSEIGSIILGSSIPVTLKDLFIIFLERTLVTLPVIAVIAHVIF